MYAKRLTSYLRTGSCFWPTALDDLKSTYATIIKISRFIRKLTESMMTTLRKTL